MEEKRKKDKRFTFEYALRHLDARVPVMSTDFLVLRRRRAAYVHYYILVVHLGSGEKAASGRFGRRIGWSWQRAVCLDHPSPFPFVPVERQDWLRNSSSQLCWDRRGSCKRITGASCRRLTGHSEKGIDTSLNGNIFLLFLFCCALQLLLSCPLSPFSSQVQQMA